MRTHFLRYWGVAPAAFLVLLVTCSDTMALPPGKVVKPPRGSPPPQTRTLRMPAAYAAKGAASSQVRGGVAAGKRVSATWAPWTVVRESTHQTPLFVQFHRPPGAAAKLAAAAAEVQVLHFLTENAALFRLRDPSSELVHRATTQDRTGREHVQLDQRYRGVPVWGASLVGHWSVEEGLYAINGRTRPSPDHVTDVEPSLPRQAAIDRALAHLRQHRSIEIFSPGMQELLDYRGPEAELFLWSPRREEPLRLTWCVEIRPNVPERWRYFVDAHTGEVLQHYQASPTEGPALGSGVDLAGTPVDLHTYEQDGVFYLVDGSREGFRGLDPETGAWYGALVTLDANNTDLEEVDWITSADNVFTDSVAVSAHHHIARTYDYFLEHHGRRGIFPDGRSVISVIHVTEEGEPMDNAFWNGEILGFGDGGVPDAAALDVAAHEMTHGIIDQTVNLEYLFQSGALNESFADIFGAMVDDEDWLIGEDENPGAALRDLQYPNNWGQPAHMDEYWELDLEEDNGGVHVNSGIPNHAAYLLAEDIGRNKAAQIYYHILDSRYLAPSSEFIDCRLAAERAARDLFGDGSPEVEAVSSAYEAVGITLKQAPEPPAEVAAGQGEQWVATVAAELDGDNSLWLVKPTREYSDGWEDLFQLTTTQVFTGSGRAVAAPVNGDFLLFVDSDTNLRYIHADGSGEEVLDDTGDWYSIALSPDGNRLVATTQYDEPIIYFFDLIEPDSNRAIELYHPTTQDDIYQDIARFADALQWDATGTYVMYDVFNSRSGPAGETVEYWTVNALEPTSETIFPVFPPQPEGVHLANPSLSSAMGPDGAIDDCRLLYERVDEPNLRSEIRVMDFCTGQDGILYALPDTVVHVSRIHQRGS